MAKTTPAEFFRKTQELKLFEYMLQREEKAVLVCDTRFFNYIQSGLKEDNRRIKPGILCWSEIKASLPEALEPYANIFVCSIANEAAILRAIRTRAPGKTAFGMVNDVATCLAAGTQPWSEHNRINLDEVLSRLDRVILIFSTARSGSTYFCDLMSSAGLCGTAKEDLRPHLIYLARHGEEINFDLLKWLSVLISENQHNGTFATKIIAHFLFKLLPSIDIQKQQLIRKKFSRIETQVIYLYRRDKIKQAVSSYFANEIKLWHVDSEAKNKELQSRTEGVKYDFKKLNHSLKFIDTHEVQLAAFMEKNVAKTLHVIYEDIVSSPSSELTRLAIAMGSEHTLRLDKAGSSLKPTSNDKTRSIEEQFRSMLSTEKATNA